MSQAQRVQETQPIIRRLDGTLGNAIESSLTPGASLSKVEERGSDRLECQLRATQSGAASCDVSRPTEAIEGFNNITLHSPWSMDFIIVFTLCLLFAPI